MSIPGLDVYVPPRDELEANLSSAFSLEQRVEYAESLIEVARLAATASVNLARDLERAEAQRDAAREELKNLRQKLGELGPGDRAALDQRYEMLGKLTRARAEVGVLERAIDESLKRMKKVLEK